MKIMSLFILSTLLVILAPFEFIFAESKKDCEISVKYFYKTGATEIKQYYLNAKSKNDCEKKSKLYKENSTPQKVKKKEVSSKWTGI